MRVTVKRRTPRFDLTEVFLVAVACLWLGWVVAPGVVTWLTPPPPDAIELAYLERVYGPSRFSENTEEWIIRDFFQDRRDGLFVDVGAGHPEVGSNTMYLERQLGWRGLAIDAQESYAAEYARLRPQTTFVAAFVSDRTGDKVRFFLNTNQPTLASASKRVTSRWREATGSVDLPTVSLTDALDHFGVKTMQFLNLDVELYEPQALAGFDIKRFRPELVCIEAHAEVRQAILDYFDRHDYTLIGKYLGVDRRNLYFKPLDHPIEPFPESVLREVAHGRGH